MAEDEERNMSKTLSDYMSFETFVRLFMIFSFITGSIIITYQNWILFIGILIFTWGNNASHYLDSHYGDIKSKDQTWQRMRAICEEEA